MRSVYTNAKIGREHVVFRFVPFDEEWHDLLPLSAGKLYRFSFLPLALTGLDGSPMRAVAWCEDS